MAGLYLCHVKKSLISTSFNAEGWKTWSGGRKRGGSVKIFHPHNINTSENDASPLHLHVNVTPVGPLSTIHMWRAGIKSTVSLLANSLHHYTNIFRMWHVWHTNDFDEPAVFDNTGCEQAQTPVLHNVQHCLQRASVFPLLFFLTANAAIGICTHVTS